MPHLICMNSTLLIADNLKSRVMQSTVIVDDTSISVDARGYAQGLGLRLRCRDFCDYQAHPKFNRDGLTMDLIMQHKGHIAFEQLMMHDRMGQA